MSNLILDSLAIYGLKSELPTNIIVNDRQVIAVRREKTQIIDVIGLQLPMNNSYIVNWSYNTSSNNGSSSIILTVFLCILLRYFLL